MGSFYSGEGVTMFGGNRRSGREEIDSVRSFCFLSSRSVKIETKKRLRMSLCVCNVNNLDLNEWQFTRTNLLVSANL